MRTGAHALSLLSVPLNVHVLQALDEEPRSLVDLRRAVGSPPQTTMRGHLRALTEMGVLERRRQTEFPGSVDYELGRPGRDLLAVAKVLQAWLEDSPHGPAQLGTGTAKSSIKALVEGWSSAIVRALAAKPLSLTELSSLIAGLSYPSLERRLVALKRSGLIEACAGAGRRTPYLTTRWLRIAIAPLSLAARWERQYLARITPPIRQIDIEAALLLAIPLVSLPADLSGSCRLAVEIPSEGSSRMAGVLIEVQDGRILSCVARLQGSAGAWASGSTPAWLSAVIEQDTGRIEVGGQCDLAFALLRGLNGALFGIGQLN